MTDQPLTETDKRLAALDFTGLPQDVYNRETHPTLLTSALVSYLSKLGYYVNETMARQLRIWRNQRELGDERVWITVHVAGGGISRGATIFFDTPVRRMGSLTYQPKEEDTFRVVLEDLLGTIMDCGEVWYRDGKFGHSEICNNCKGQLFCLTNGGWYHDKP